MNFDIISVGSAGFDIFLSGKDLKPGITQTNSAIVLDDDSQYTVDHSVYETGGTGLNSAITFARQGIKTACLAKTGRDHLANQIKVVAHHEGVGHELFVNKPEHHTDLAVHIITERNHQITLNYHNSLHSLRGSDLRFPGLKSRLLYLAELPVDFKLTKLLLLWARTNGAQVVLHAKDFAGYRPKQFNFVLAHLYRLITPWSLVQLLGFEDPQPHETLRYLKSLGLPRCVLYDGLDQTYAFEDETVFEAGSYKKLNPLDWTGVEDVYAASYTAGLFQQKSVPEALTLAAANATSVASVVGTRSGILQKPALRTIKTTTSIL